MQDRLRSDDVHKKVCYISSVIGIICAIVIFITVTVVYDAYQAHFWDLIESPRKHYSNAGPLSAPKGKPLIKSKNLLAKTLCNNNIKQREIACSNKNRTFSPLNSVHLNWFTEMKMLGLVSISTSSSDEHGCAMPLFGAALLWTPFTFHSRVSTPV